MTTKYDAMIGPLCSKPSPCKDCPDRHEKCHMECEKYLNWKDDVKATARNKQQDDQRYIISDTKRKWLNRSLRRNSK